MPTISGDPEWTEDIELAEDGDPASGATWDGYYGLANRGKFLRRLAASALANLTVKRDEAPSVSYNLYDVCFADGGGNHDAGLFVAVGTEDGIYNGRMWVSHDGEGFAVLPIGSLSLIGVCAGGPGSYGSRRIVMVGVNASGPIARYTNDHPIVLSSVTLPGGIGPGIVLNSVAWNGTIYVMCGTAGTLASFTDPSSTVTQRTPDSSFASTFHKVFVSGSRFILGGASGEIQTSDDGITYTRRNSNATHGNIRQFARIGTTIIAKTEKTETILRSVNNGGAWAEITLNGLSSVLTTPTVEFVTAFAGIMMAVLFDSTNNRRFALLSYDKGATWPAKLRIPTWGNYDTGSNYRFTASADDGGRLVIVGNLASNALAYALATPRIPEI